MKNKNNILKILITENKIEGFIVGKKQIKRELVKKRFLREKWKMPQDTYDVLKGAVFQCIMSTKRTPLNHVWKISIR